MTEWNGQKIKKLRKSLGFTQLDMAKEIGAVRQTISKWELEETVPDGMARKLLSIMEEKALYGRQDKS